MPETRKSKPHEVGTLKPNPYGLKDMHGNVAEWVEDCFHENYKDAPLTELAWTAGPYCNRRVVRGGNWLSDVKALRSASRDWHPFNDDSSDQIGFRLAREITVSGGPREVGIVGALLARPNAAEGTCRAGLELDEAQVAIGLSFIGPHAPYGRRGPWPTTAAFATIQVVGGLTRSGGSCASDRTAPQRGWRRQ